MGRLSGHPHIVSVFDIGATASGRPYIVMQYHPGGSLDARIHTVGPIDWRDAVHIGVQVAGALETAHRCGILHRDVKPGNILLTEYGEPALTDFGIARIAGGFETATGVVMGSPAFTAPEVLQGAGADRGLRRLRSGCHAVLRDHRSRGVRTPQRGKGCRPVSADREGADPGPARGGHPRRRVRRPRAGHVTRDRRPSRYRGRVRRACCGRCSSDTVCRSTRCRYPSLRAESMAVLGDAADPR